jgi:hypothetical protein
MAAFWLVIRVFAGVAGAVVGWLFSGLLVRLLVRLAFHRPTPRPILLLGRMVVAVVAGLLVYYYLHPGGSGGWGLGGGGFGLGGGGTGPGTGSSSTSAETRKAETARTTAKASPADTLRIEMLGGDRYPGEGRYYLIQGKMPAQTLEEVESILKQDRGRYHKMEIVIYLDSVAEDHQAVSWLRSLAARYDLSLTTTRPGRTSTESADKK